MSTKPVSVAAAIRSPFGPVWHPRSEDPEAASAALAVTVALLRGLRDRGLLTSGEIDDLFDEAAERFQKNSAASLIDGLRAEVHRKTDE